ncbi:hypothetical protein DIS24_g10596 [Lasiodiplodia hormozganensis]|uniref:Uncharacterized protein n=1 Tax=Lasiodiplodia hormozganensis TaxID=869390 RepID=A0AA40CGR1_9PEZI|nr:hypothetical protein DIS24_g10596 [Lasiodiplodia hormozganensis]
MARTNPDRRSESEQADETFLDDTPFDPVLTEPIKQILRDNGIDPDAVTSENPLTFVPERPHYLDFLLRMRDEVFDD